MIVPMKRVCLMVQEKTRDEALLRLREAGVVHLEKSAAPEGVSKAGERKVKVESAIGLINEAKAQKKKKPAGAKSGAQGRSSSEVSGTGEQPYLPDFIVNIGKERKALQDRSLHLLREISRLETWGNFDPASIKELASLGLPVYLYELNNDAFASLDPNTRYIKIAANKTSVRIAVLDNEIPSVTPFQPAEKSLEALRKEVNEIKIKMEEIDEKLRNLSDRHSFLIDEMSSAERDIEFENASAAMEIVEDIPEDYGISYLTGFVPVDEMPNLKKAAAKNNWALSVDDPDEADEKVPTKLKNSKFVNLLNPVTGFLGIVPGYRETDISPWFLFFFCIFFGMIFGDAAYGLILMLIALMGIIKTAKKGVPQILPMLLLLGFFNTAWGVLTCSWFGVDIDKLPQILKDISLSYISTAKTDQAIVEQNLQIFCFSLGLLQLTIAHLKGFFRNIKSLKLFAELGSIAMLWGMYNVILFLVVSNDTRAIPLLPISIYLLAGGFFFSFVFASYEGNIGKSILESCKNIISVVLGITNVFSDIMSYIRLWAVGLAGASIATTVNTMAGPLMGGFLMFAAVILLVFGHGLNLILNVLSVLVHGVRLNTLEFSGHVGLTWSGTAYKPFAEKAQKSG